MSEIHEKRGEHGPDCTCGCHDHEREGGHVHDHEHAHVHGHEHGHEHAHDRSHNHERAVELGWGTGALESHVHDQAATVSLTINAQADAGRTFQELVDALQQIALQVESAGGIVGHIKAYAREGEAFVHASATDAQHAPACEGDASLVLGPATNCQFVSIALLIDLAQLEQIVLAALV